MRKERYLIALGMVFFLVFSTFVTLAPDRVMAQQTYNWKLQSVWLTAVAQDGLRQFAENVKKATNGKVNITVYDANQLVKIMATLSAVQSGAIEMGCSAGPYNAGVIPEAHIEFGLPFSWRTWEEAWEAWTKYGLREKIREAYAEKGLYILTIEPASGYFLMSTKPVQTTDDLRGLKVRTTGMVAKIIAKFGAVPTMIPGPEQYVALQRGTVDATLYPLYVLDAYKLKEVIKYIVYPSFISPPTMEIYINLKLWNSLSPGLQKTINEAAVLHQAGMDKRFVREGDAAVATFLTLGGQKITLPESEVKKFRKAAFDEWESLAAKSPRCNELVDIVKKFMADKGISAE